MNELEREKTGQSEPAEHTENAEGEHAPAHELPAPSLRMAPKQPQKPFFRRNPVTVLFVLLLVACYIGVSFPNDFQEPTQGWIALGGFYPPAVQAGEWWRYITATLLHGNPTHLLNNAIGLLIFGNMLESVLGSLGMVCLYVISAVAGLALSYVMMPEGLTIGASTIDYGLIGAYFTLILLMRYRYNREAFAQEFRGTLLFVLLFIGWNTMESATVNLWGHMGGFAGGVVFAGLLWTTRSRQRA